MVVFPEPEAPVRMTKGIDLTIYKRGLAEEDRLPIGFARSNAARVQVRASGDAAPPKKHRRHYVNRQVLPVNPADLGAFEREIVHQPLLIEDKAYDRAFHRVAIDRAASAHGDDGNRAVDANLPAILVLE
jgi:hypothetical protein